MRKRYIQYLIIFVCINVSVSVNVSLAQDNPFKAQIDQRILTFERINQAIRGLRTALYADNPVDWTESHKTIVQLESTTRTVRTLFPIGSHIGSNSIPSLWENKADFDQRMDHFLQELEQMDAAVQSKNLQQLHQSLEKIGGTCRSCHRLYKSS